MRFVRDEQGRGSRLLVNARDITERKESELRLKEKQQELEQALERERLLRREVHHRIKNDMNLVTSMLSLQIRETTNPDARTSLQKATDRIMVMGEVYEMLYSSADFDEVDAKRLVERLASNFNTGPALRREAIHIECDDFLLPTRVGVSLGIIVNELLTNAFKYGNDTSQEQRVRAEVKLVDQRRFRVTVRDTGSGFPEEVLRGQHHGFGLTVVSALTEQHDGELKITNENGGVVEVTLPLQ